MLYSFFFRLTFKILNVECMIWWNITVTFSTNNVGVPTDVSAVETIGERVNEDHIKAMAESTPTGIDFIANFIENIEQYIQRRRKKLKFLNS